MIIKRIIAGVLVVLLLNINFAYAENWVTITAENGKSADLDLDSIQMVIDTVEYNIKTKYNGFVYLNKMSTELYNEGSPTAVIERAKYKDDAKLTDEKLDKRDYRALKSGTLQAEIFDVLSKELDKKEFSQGKSTWKKYLKKQRKDIYKKWTPYENWFSTYSNYSSPVYINDIVLTIDKDGVIQNPSHEISQFTDLVELDPLPEDYTAETFQLDVKMNYYKYAGAKKYTKKPVVKQISPVRSEITIAKNKRPPVIGHIQWAFLSGLKGLNKAYEAMNIDESNLFTFLFYQVPVCILGCGVYIILFLFFALSGGDTNDI